MLLPGHMVTQRPRTYYCIALQVAALMAGLAGCWGINKLLQANLKQQEDEMIAALDREAANSTAKYWSGDKE